MQRGHHHLVPRLLAAGADPDRVDDHGRTPADWLALHRPGPGGRPGAPGFVPTGIRAVDLFAPLHRGRVQHWPPAVGLGQTVLLFAIAAALRPAEFWLLGFEHGPYSQAGAEGEIRVDRRRLSCAPLAFGRGLLGARRAQCRVRSPGCLRDPRPKLVALLKVPGTHTTSCSRLPTLARDANVLGVIVIEPFTGTLPKMGRLRPRVSTRRSCSTCGGRVRILAAVDPRHAPRAVGTERRHEQLAAAARAGLASVSFEGDAELP